MNFSANSHSHLATKINIFVQNRPDWLKSAHNCTKKCDFTPKNLSLNEIKTIFVARSGVIHGKGNALWSGTRAKAVLERWRRGP